MYKRQGLFDAASRQDSPQELPLWSGLRLQTQAFRPGKQALAAHSTAMPGHGKALKDVQTDMIRDAVTQARGNVAEAARVLGISRATVYRKLGNPKGE